MFNKDVPFSGKHEHVHVNLAVLSNIAMMSEGARKAHTHAINIWNPTNNYIYTCSRMQKRNLELHV